MITDGEIRLLGRAGDLINVAARKVAPESVERALESLPCVRECIVFGTPAAENGRGEDITAFVVLREATSEAALRQALGALVPAWQVPRVWHFGESLPVNERGKLSRAELARRFVPRD
jgi:acyl-coenzyme A synthetase/AMP-(fatty) acid ligase